MGHKINPIGFRVGITKPWSSSWFDARKYKDSLINDWKIRTTILSKVGRNAGVSAIEIKRSPKEVNILVRTSRPGIVIGRAGSGINDLRKLAEKVLPKGTKFSIDIVEVKQPELVARLVSDQIANQIERRISTRRAAKQALGRVMEAGAKGVKIQLSGRLEGAEIARREVQKDGSIPLGNLNADIDYAHSDAKTTYGVIGVKVWIHKGKNVQKEED
jgi:small subunit ribosomal protein S3